MFQCKREEMTDKSAVLLWFEKFGTPVEKASYEERDNTITHDDLIFKFDGANNLSSIELDLKFAIQESFNEAAVNRTWFLYPPKS